MGGAGAGPGRAWSAAGGSGSQAIPLRGPAGSLGAGGLSGFIVGLAVGPVAAHLFLTLHIPARQGEMLRQSARFTTMAGFTGLAAVVLTLWLRDVTTTPVWVVAVILSALMPLLVAARVAYYKVWPDGRRKNAIIMVSERSETP